MSIGDEKYVQNFDQKSVKKEKLENVVPSWDDTNVNGVQNC
jgi:hypothetical protein